MLLQMTQKSDYYDYFITTELLNTRTDVLYYRDDTSKPHVLPFH